MISTFKVSEHYKNFCQPGSSQKMVLKCQPVPHMVMSAFKGSLEEKPPFSLNGMTVRKVSS